MTADEITQLTGASRATITRWMRDRAFPRPTNAPRKPAEWDRAAVTRWWNDNQGKVGRWPKV